MYNKGVWIDEEIAAVLNDVTAEHAEQSMEIWKWTQNENDEYWWAMETFTMVIHDNVSLLLQICY